MSGFDELRRELSRGVERQASPARRPLLRRHARNVPLIAVVATLGLGGVAVAAVGFLDSSARQVTGAAGSGELKLSEPTRTASARSTGNRIGLLTYRSQSGGLCFVTGPVRDGQVGSIGKGGTFTPTDPADAPGMCGEFDENIAEFGGIALGSSSASEEDPKRPQAVVYGVVGDPRTIVTVTAVDGTELPVEVKRVAGLGSASAAFSVPLPVGAPLEGATVTLTSRAGRVLHTFEL